MEDIELKLKQAIKQAFSKMNVELSLDSIVIEHSKDKAHGDYASTVCMQNARTLRKAPVMIAKDLIENIHEDYIDHIEIAGPGFVNFFIKADSLASILDVIINEGDNYGSSKEKKKERINVEFVSANPTGTLHLGHARGAALGDSISRLYEKAGYDITREYYINDAGVQIDNLANSLRVRYHEVLGDNSLELPENGYHSKDLIEIAKKMVDEVGDIYLKDDTDSQSYFKRRGTKLLLDKLLEDLTDFRVKFDIFSSELDIRNAGKVEKVIETLKPYTYEQDGALFLKTTDFTDDKDRVIIKKDGSYTYLLPDIAYHKDKFDRGFDKLVDCLGADHHGYIERMKSSMAMLGYNPDNLDIELYQMVRLFKNGEEYKMSKRTGNAVGMRELCDEVGVDAVRYFFVSRASTSHLDFDLDLASKMESSNPVYYAQYAHARLAQVLEKGKDYPLELDASLLTSTKEIGLLKTLAEFPQVVESSASQRAPYKICNYIQKLATAIHEFYTECKIVDENEKKLTSSRLVLAKGSIIVMKNALDLIGVSAPNKM